MLLKNYKSWAQKNWAHHNIAHSKAGSGPDKKVDKLFDHDLDNVIEHSANNSEKNNN